jgi:hypothetical protein
MLEESEKARHNLGWSTALNHARKVLPRCDVSFEVSDPAARTRSPWRGGKIFN